MDTANPLTRRTLLAASLAVPALMASASASASAAATPPRRVPSPETVHLPDGFRPEGVASGPAGTLYSGSLADGRVHRTDLTTGARGVLVQGQQGKALRGMQHDGRSGLLWATGNEGPVGTVYAYVAATGTLAYRLEVPGAAFLNDLVVTVDAVWVTDSGVDMLTRVPLSASGAPGAGFTQVPLSGEWPTPQGLRANGIRELDRSTLVINNSTAGGIYAVDKASGSVLAIPVSGGPGLTGGDGLERAGDLLYDVRGSGQHVVSVLALDGSGPRWTARWRGELADETLSVPSTATLDGGWLWAVNARFGAVPDPATASYWITRLPARIR